MKRLLSLLKYALWGLVLWFGIHTLLVVRDGLSDAGDHAGLAVVLGNKVHEDGSLSARLQARLDKSVELFRDGRVQWILVSGGLGKEGFWEGDKMKDYLLAKGIPSGSILVDNYGDNTEKTVEHTLQVADSLNLGSVIAVSQYFHITRIKLLFKKQGNLSVAGAAPRYFEWRDGYALFREFVAYYAVLSGR